MVQLLVPVVRMALASLLGNPEVKKRVVDELRAEAKKTDSKLDDEAVDAFAAIWDVVVPAIGKKG